MGYISPGLGLAAATSVEAKVGGRVDGAVFACLVEGTGDDEVSTKNAETAKAAE